MNRARVVTLVWLCCPLALTACGDGDKKLELGGSCSLNSDCRDPLVCKFGSCHQACMQSRDCAAGERCVQVDGLGVCQQMPESACVYGGPPTCKTPLVCAPDDICRNTCSPTSYCLGGQVCAGGFCVEYGEADAGQGGDSGASGGPDAGVDAGGRDTAAADAPAAARDVMPPREAGPEAADTRQDAWDAPLPQDAASTGEVGTRPMDAEPIDVGRVPCVGEPISITYDATALPSAAQYAGMFDYNATSGASWSVANGELKMTTSAGANVYLGRNSRATTGVNWDFAPSDMGNTMTVRAKLGPNSEKWYAYFGNPSAGVQPVVYFMQGHVVVRNSGSTYQGKEGYMQYDIDTLEYHAYTLAAVGGRQVVAIDGIEIGSSPFQTDQASSDWLITVGDGNAPSNSYWGGYETGTFYVQQVTIQTYTACAAPTPDRG